MSTGNPSRTRSDRVAAAVTPRNRLIRLWDQLNQRSVLLRLSMCVLAAIVLWLATAGWAPPLGYRKNDIPSRDIVARVDFSREDIGATQTARSRARERAAAQVVNIYTNDSAPLEQLRHALKGHVFQVIRAESFADLEPGLWYSFLEKQSDESTPDPTSAEAAFAHFRTELKNDPELVEFEKAIERVFIDFERHGLLEKLDHGDSGSKIEIYVQPAGTDLEIKSVEAELFVTAQGTDKPLPLIPVRDVRIAEISSRLKEELAAQLKSPIVAEHVFHWFEPQLPTTLTWNQSDSDLATQLSADVAEAAVQPVLETFTTGERLPAIHAGTPLSEDNIQLLTLEYHAYLDELPLRAMIWRSFFYFGMFVAIYTMCGVYIHYREPQIIQQWKRLGVFLALFVVVVAVSPIPLLLQWRVEFVPILLFGIVMTIAYRQDLALLLTAAISLVVVLTTGRGLTEFVIYVATAAAAIQSSASIRSRTKLIYVGVYAGLVAMLTTLGVHIVVGTPMAWALLTSAALYGLMAFLSGVIMTGALPFIESMFDVQTEISLLELGDAAHPLLQELVRRAPGTYNHSINVASIAEAAADAIGANGLLVRVGAYFHDIGKMLKSQYFVENQGEEGNRHESLVPAMSTLVIIAHVKDGADLARQYHLPNAIIDFIEQHHGTTLVEYFYVRARGQSELDPNGETVDESSFRYPGPKPQNKEAAVLMLADAVESASRTLVDPAPARIESLVQEIAMKRLLDGQFDECELTLSELRVIETSIAKSLTAVFHGRVKYPNQQTA